MTRKIFVTGTDTGVGKTVVSTILSLGMKGCYWKPIQAGVEPCTDSDFVGRHLQKDQIWDEAFRLSTPCSPHAAAQLEGRHISFQPSWQKRVRDCTTPLVVEGAGGALVPVNDSDLMVDLMVFLGLPVLVVTPSRLGMINQTLMTLEALRRRHLEVLGVVAVGESHGVSFNAIELHGKVNILGHIPRIHDLSTENFKTLFRENNWEACFG